MLKIEHLNTTGWEAALRGMRNPLDSWAKADTAFCTEGAPLIGLKDLDLMRRLIKGGPEHRKFLRMITVTMDITAPLYWWKQFDTYKVGTVRDSCSTMHTIHKAEFTREDFSTDGMSDAGLMAMDGIIQFLNVCRDGFLRNKDKAAWRDMIAVLPENFMQKATVMMNYEVILTIVRQRAGHKLTEWQEFIEMAETLPYFDLLEVEK